MTALCSGGTSSSQTQFGAAVAIGTAQIAATLNNVPTALAVAAAGYIGLIAYDLSQFCITDPPAMPTLTAADWVSLLTISGPVSHLQAIQKFQDFLANYFWPLFCKCDTGTTPPQPALPTPPANLPTVQPSQIPNATLAQPCWTVRKKFTIPIAPQSGNFTGVIDESSMLPINPGPSHSEGDGTFPGEKIPLGATSITYSATLSALPIPNFGVNAIIRWLDATGTQVDLPGSFPGDWSSTSSLTQSGTIAIPTDAVFWTFHFSNGDETKSFDIDYTFNINCGGTGGSLSTPCCPPDPELSAQLQSILQLVTSIYQGLPAPLTSYAEGTVHAGLSGHGTILLAASVLGVKVTITADNTHLGSAIETPTFLFDRGYIVPIINEGPISAVSRLIFSPQVFLIPALTEQIGYSLSPGVTISITELVRGP